MFPPQVPCLVLLPLNGQQLNFAPPLARIVSPRFFWIGDLSIFVAAPSPADGARPTWVPPILSFFYRLTPPILADLYDVEFVPTVLILRNQVRLFAQRSFYCHRRSSLLLSEFFRWLPLVAQQPPVCQVLPGLISSLAL